MMGKNMKIEKKEVKRNVIVHDRWKGEGAIGIVKSVNSKIFFATKKRVDRKIGSTRLKEARDGLLHSKIQKSLSTLLLRRLNSSSSVSTALMTGFRGQIT